MIEGLIICFFAAGIATLLATFQNIVGAPLLGLFIGILLGNILPKSILERSQKGAAFASKRILRIGIILAGATLNFKAIINVGVSSLPVVIGAIVFAFAAAWVWGRLMGVPKNTRLLVGGGTSICGGTAVATLSAVIEAKEDETAYAMTSIFLFDIIACIIWPYVALWMNLSPEQFGLLGGIAINDVSSVTAASQSYNALLGPAAYNAAGVSGGDIAMIVKLTRVAMLVVVAVVMTLVHQVDLRRQNTSANGNSVTKNIVQAFPFYVLGFLALAVVNTFMNFENMSIGTASVSSIVTWLYKFCFAVALVGVGYKIRIGDLLKNGVKPIILGGLTWGTISALVLGYILIFN